MPTRPPIHGSKTPAQRHAARSEAQKIRDSAAWKKARAWVKASRPLCEDPWKVHGDSPTPTEHIHHIIPVAARPDLAFTESNLQAVCEACHQRYNQLERGNG